MNTRTPRIRAAGLLVVLASALVFAAAQTAQTVCTDPPATEPAQLGEDSAAPHFEWLDVYLDSGPAPLAAYQFELTAAAGDFQIVGLEGGQHPAFTAPPYYDPAALTNDRVIVAAFSTADDLPTGRTRVARVHVMVTGDQPQYLATLAIAATAGGRPITVDLQIEQGVQP